MKICIAASYELAEKVKNFLGISKFAEVKHFSMSMSVLQQMRNGQRWTIAYIDENLPDIPGSSLAALLQHDIPQIPIVLMNGFKKDDLLSQLDTILTDFEVKSLYSSPPPCNSRLKNFVFNSKKSTVYKKGEPIRLRKKEAQLLEYLLRYKDRLVTKQTLLEAVWAYKYSHNSHTLSSHIAQLRQKLGSDVIHIKNLPRQGYLLTQVT